MSLNDLPSEHRFDSEVSAHAEIVNRIAIEQLGHLSNGARLLDWHIEVRRFAETPATFADLLE